MINELLDVSINTMIGLLPSIINYNNQLIENEFDSIVRNNKLTVDVSSNNVHSHNGDFDILTIGGLTIVFDNITSTQEKISSLDVSIASLDASMAYAFNHLYTGLSASMTYGDSVSSINEVQTVDTNINEYDFSSFFTTGGKGKVTGITTEQLYKVKAYRVIDGLKISLNIGTIIIGGKLRMMIYHDHIDTSGSSTIVQRVYVTIVNGSDRNSIQQYGSAATVNI